MSDLAHAVRILERRNDRAFDWDRDRDALADLLARSEGLDAQTLADILADYGFSWSPPGETSDGYTPTEAHVKKMLAAAPRDIRVVRLAAALSQHKEPNRE